MDIFIQVRLNSRRVPRKALLDLGDDSCLGHVIERCKDVSRARRVVVCTSTSSEDLELESLATDRGVDFFAGSLDDCVGRFLACAAQFGTDVIVRVTGDSPLLDAHTIDQAIALLLAEKFDYVVAKPAPVGSYVEVFRVEALERGRACAKDTEHSEHITYFVNDGRINRLGHYHPSALLARPDLVFALNRPVDLDVLQHIFEEAPRSGRYLSLEEAIRFCDDHPESTSANRDYTPAPGPHIPDLDVSRLETLS